MLRVRVRYGRAGDFLKDHETQLAHRGLFVRVAPPESLAQFDPVELTVEFASSTAVLAAQAVQVAPGVGVAVSFSEGDAAELAPLLDAARVGGADNDVDPQHEIVPAGGSARSEPRPAVSGKAEKIQKALHGTKDERLKILRDNDKSLHMYVLKNPRLGLDEVTTLAKTATTSVEVIKTIAERREWCQRPEVASALVRNPKTPVPIAVRLLDFISKQELRRLAKSDGARMPILQAARKKVIGPALIAVSTLSLTLSQSLVHQDVFVAREHRANL